MSKGKVRAIYLSVHYEDDSEVRIGVKSPQNLSLDYYGDQLILNTKGEFDFRERDANPLPQRVFELSSVYNGMWVEIPKLGVSGFLRGVTSTYFESRFGEEQVSSVSFAVTNEDGSSASEHTFITNDRIKLRRKHDVT